MMNCFPVIYEGELFYSLIARYKRMTGITNKKSLRCDFYGKDVSLESVYFVIHADKIVSNLPMNTLIKPEDIIKNNSLYRFFTAFVDREEALEVLKSMRKDEGYNGFAKLGLIGSKVELNNRLKYCYRCVEEDIEKYGESYWRVLHQIPGVLTCEKHKVRLSESNVCSSNSRLEHICLDTISIKPNDFGLSDKIATLNDNYIKNVKYILENDIENKNKDFYNGFIIDRFRGKGVVSAGGNIKIDKFEMEFIEYYGQEYLNLMQSGIDVKQKSNWLRRFVRNDNKKRHPLRYLLILEFLGISFEEYITNKSVRGKLTSKVVHTPRLDIDEQRKRWLKFLAEHQGLSKSELKKLGKGLYTWLYRHDNQWFNDVTPKRKNGSNIENVKEWTSADNELLNRVKIAVSEMLSCEGKPIRLTKAAIRRHLSEGKSFNNKKLVRTNQYIYEITESNEVYWERKIKWAIEELYKEGLKVSRYKVQLKAGFGGTCQDKIKKLIDKILYEL